MKAVDLKCHFKDKYRFYQAFLLPRQRPTVFVPHHDALEPGTSVVMHVYIQQDDMTLQLPGAVSGWRPKFTGTVSAGVHVQLDDASRVAARKQLELLPTIPAVIPARAWFRRPLRLPIMIKSDSGQQEFTTLDFSRGGCKIPAPRQTLGAHDLGLTVRVGNQELHISGSLQWQRDIGGKCLAGIAFEQPCAVQEELLQELHQELGAPKAPQTRRVLVADDEPVIRSLIGEILEPQGIEVIHAENGEDAISLAREMQPDLFLLDVLMPRLDGFDVCSIIKRDAHMQHMPVIIMSCLDVAETSKSATQAEAAEFLAKPFDLQVLRDLVQRYLGL